MPRALARPARPAIPNATRLSSCRKYSSLPAARSSNSLGTTFTAHPPMRSFSLYFSLHIHTGFCRIVSIQTSSGHQICPFAAHRQGCSRPLVEPPARVRSKYMAHAPALRPDPQVCPDDLSAISALLDLFGRPPIRRKNPLRPWRGTAQLSAGQPAWPRDPKACHFTSPRWRRRQQEILDPARIATRQHDPASSGSTAGMTPGRPFVGAVTTCPPARSLR